VFTNKVKYSIIWGGKGKDRVMLIKSVISMRVGRGAHGARCYRFKRIVVNDQKV